MKLLEEKLQREGEVLGDDILRVDSFVSHQVERTWRSISAARE